MGMIGSCRGSAKWAAFTGSCSSRRLPAQRSWTEVPFGGDYHVNDLTPEQCARLPWDPLASVVLCRRHDDDSREGVMNFVQIRVRWGACCPWPLTGDPLAA